MPIWAFHGQNDVVVDVRYTDDMVNAVRRLGNDDVRYTRYQNSPAYEKYPEMIGIFFDVSLRFFIACIFCILNRASMGYSV